MTSLERLPQTDDVQKQIIDARTALGLYMLQMTHHVEAKEAIAPVIDLAISHDYKKRLCQIYTILGAYYCCVEDSYSEAFQAFEGALKISEEIADNATSFFASFWLGCALSWNCEFEKASNYIQRSLNISLATKNLWGIAVTKSCLAYFSYYHNGKLNLQFETSSEALRIAEESGDVFSEGMSYICHGISYYGKRFLKEAESLLLKGLALCERINLYSFNGVARVFLGETYFEMGDFTRSKEHYEKGSWIIETNRLFPSLAGLGKVSLARSKVLNKERDVNLDYLYAHARNNKIKVFEGWISRYIAEILLNLEDPKISEAEHWIQKAIEANRRNGMMFHLGKDYAAYADLFNRKGNKLKARENLAEAIEIFIKCGADGWAENYEKVMSALG